MAPASSVRTEVVVGRSEHDGISGHYENFTACPLYPRKRTSIAAGGMSAVGQKQTFGAFSELLISNSLLTEDLRRFGDF